MYHPVQSRVDQELFQKDLTALGRCTGMRFDAAKCNNMRISHSTKPLTRFYSLCNCILQEVDQVEYLGVSITKELQWSGHITSTTAKANASQGFLRRSLKNCPQIEAQRGSTYFSFVVSSWVQFLYMGPMPCQRHQFHRAYTTACSMLCEIRLSHNQQCYGHVDLIWAEKTSPIADATWG